MTGNILGRGRAGSVDAVEAAALGFGLEFRSDSRRRTRVREEDSAERNGRGSGGDELERVPSRLDPAHADDRKPSRAVGSMHGGKGDRAKPRS